MLLFKFNNVQTSYDNMERVQPGRYRCQSYIDSSYYSGCSTAAVALIASTKSSHCSVWVALVSSNQENVSVFNLLAMASCVSWLKRALTMTRSPTLLEFVPHLPAIEQPPTVVNHVLPSSINYLDILNVSLKILLLMLRGGGIGRAPSPQPGASHLIL